MLKVSKGNMYDWVTHMHNHLGGRCPHDCDYCYVETPRWGRNPRYDGPVRLIEDEFNVKYGENKTIFMEHMNDIAAVGVPDKFIVRILEHALVWPKNTYVFQSKNPERLLMFREWFPERLIYGTTIETNRDTEWISNAPPPSERANAIKTARENKIALRTFITIEPVLQFDVDDFLKMLVDASPDFINIGADSKNHGLPEPTMDDILDLADGLKKNGIEVRKKINLERLVPSKRI